MITGVAEVKEAKAQSIIKAEVEEQTQQALGNLKKGSDLKTGNSENRYKQTHAQAKIFFPTYNPNSIKYNKDVLYMSLVFLTWRKALCKLDS